MLELLINKPRSPACTPNDTTGRAGRKKIHATICRVVELEGEEKIETSLEKFNWGRIYSIRSVENQFPGNVCVRVVLIHEHTCAYATNATLAYTHLRALLPDNAGGVRMLQRCSHLASTASMRVVQSRYIIKPTVPLAVA